jgi:glycosyltransferase involved in cell wall biosynthesis
MKVLLVSKSAGTGGAAIAAVRLVKVLREYNIDAKLLVQERENTDDGVYSTTHYLVKKWINFCRFAMERLFFLRHEKSKEIRFLFSTANTGEHLARNKYVKEADIIHLQWINGGFLSLNSLEELLNLGKPIVWTFHDMWPLTGGCHHALTCDRYTQECGQCPYLKRPGENDLSHRLWKRKMNLFSEHAITVITPSNWMHDCVSKSSLFGRQEVHTIHNAVDQTLFKPADRDQACRNLGLDLSKKYILFGAASVDNLYKGFVYFQEAIKWMDQQPESLQGLEILLFGKSKGDVSQLFPIKIHNIDFVSSVQTMVELYSAAHLYVISSLQDNFPGTVIESMLCGTPVVGFRTGGIPEMIHHLEDGYLAEHKSATDLAEGIRWILSFESYDSLSQGVRKAAVRRFSSEVSAEKHVMIYKKLLNKDGQL